MPMPMPMPPPSRGHDELTELDAIASAVLSAAEERRLLTELAECKSKLQQALHELQDSSLPAGSTRAADLASYVSATCAGVDSQVGARLGAIAHRYMEIRTRLALANVRLVAHMVRNYRERGVSHADLMQEGFLGLLEAIDRFDLGRETKLATYATWWIRQAIQRAVAAGAYPVRLTPRHLRHLAKHQEALEDGQDGGVDSELIHRIHTATRPTLSLDARVSPDHRLTLLETVSAPGSESSEVGEAAEAIEALLAGLRPREREVVVLRFGLGGGPRLSLSQVGRMLSVSKERVRQIQDRALAKLRVVAAELGLEPELAGV